MRNDVFDVFFVPLVFLPGHLEDYSYRLFDGSDVQLEVPWDGIAEQLATLEAQTVTGIWKSLGTSLGAWA